MKITERYYENTDIPKDARDVDTRKQGWQKQDLTVGHAGSE